jgi:hypothetical protein
MTTHAPSSTVTASIEVAVPPERPWPRSPTTSPPGETPTITSSTPRWSGWCSSPVEATSTTTAASTAGPPSSDTTRCGGSPSAGTSICTGTMRPVRPATSEVEVTFTAHGDGTLVELAHRPRVPRRGGRRCAARLSRRLGPTGYVDSPGLRRFGRVHGRLGRQGAGAWSDGPLGAPRGALRSGDEPTCRAPSEHRRRSEQSPLTGGRVANPGAPTSATRPLARAPRITNMLVNIRSVIGGPT